MALSYHKVREAVAANIIGFYHISSEDNPADLMSKIWGFQQVWKQLKTLLFWHGETQDISDTIATKTVDKQAQVHSLQKSGELYDLLPSCCGEMVENLALCNHITQEVWKISFLAKLKKE